MKIYVFFGNSFLRGFWVGFGMVFGDQNPRFSYFFRYLFEAKFGMKFGRATKRLGGEQKPKTGLRTPMTHPRGVGDQAGGDPKKLASKRTPAGTWR